MKLTQRTIATIKPTDRLRVVFDDDVPGFGLRVSPPSSKNPEGAKTWILEYRPNGGGRGTSTRRLTLGSLADLKPEKARDLAEKAKAAIKLGRDPAAEKAERRAEATLKEVWLEYEAAMSRRWKPRSKITVETYFRLHILPAVGSRKISSITARDCQALHSKISIAHPVTANRVLSALRACFNWWSDLNPGALSANPARPITRNPEEGRRNYLSPEELRRLFTAIDTAVRDGVPWERRNWRKHTPGAEHRRSFVSPAAARAIKLLAYSGCRLREVLLLQWQHVDFDNRRLVLTDTKTGYRMIPLSEASLTILREAWAELPTDPKAKGYPQPAHYVFAETPGGKARADLHRPWRNVLRAAGLPADTRIHDLRHSAASLLINAGAGLELVAGVLGHRSTATARRYAHLMDSTVRSAAELIAGQIALPAPAQQAEELEDLVG